MSLIPLGRQGESWVAQHLSTDKYTILATNYRTAYGEIDIIAQKGDTIAFVEVKTRKNPYVAIGELVNFSKQKKIIKTALHYISTHTHHQTIFRFDVAYVHLDQNTPHITHIPHAFVSQML